MKLILVLAGIVGSIILTSILLAFLFHSGDYDCKDFKTQKEAQEVFNRNRDDIYGLDRDKNGKACQNLS